jgi:hypothetical protein
MHGLGDTAFGFLDLFNNENSPVTKVLIKINTHKKENKNKFRN